MLVLVFSTIISPKNYAQYPKKLDLTNFTVVWPNNTTKVYLSCMFCLANRIGRIFSILVSNFYLYLNTTGLRVKACYPGRI